MDLKTKSRMFKNLARRSRGEEAASATACKAPRRLRRQRLVVKQLREVRGVRLLQKKLKGAKGAAVAAVTTERVVTQKVGMDNVVKWLKHETEHGAINAWLNGLEKLRRLDNVNRAQDNAAEHHNVFMAGFQKCLEVQIMNGTSPRRLLGNKAFMDLIRGKDGLFAKIAEKDCQPQ